MSHLTAASVIWVATVPAEGLDATVDHALHLVALAIGVVGVAVILWGVMCAVWALVSIEVRSVLGREAHGREQLRNRLGYYLLLGLELLVAADIVETILTPDLEHLAALGGIVAIRTVISFSLNWELRQHKAPTAAED